MKLVHWPCRGWMSCFGIAAWSVVLLFLNVPIKGLTIPFSNQFNCKETVPVTASRSYIHVVDVDRVLQLPLASETSIQIESLASLSHNSSYFNWSCMLGRVACSFPFPHISTKGRVHYDVNLVGLCLKPYAGVTAHAIFNRACDLLSRKPDREYNRKYENNSCQSMGDRLDALNPKL